MPTDEEDRAALSKEMGLAGAKLKGKKQQDFVSQQGKAESDADVAHGGKVAPERYQKMKREADRVRGTEGDSKDILGSFKKGGKVKKTGLYRLHKNETVKTAKKKVKKSKGLWIQGAVSKMKKKGTLGSFGKATPKKIAAGKKKGGLAKKRAVFASNMRKIAAKRKGKSARKRA